MNAAEAKAKSDENRREIQRQKLEELRKQAEEESKRRIANRAHALVTKLPDVFQQIERRVKDGDNHTRYDIYSEDGAIAIRDHLITLGYKSSVDFSPGKEDLLEGYDTRDTWHVDINW